MFLWNLLERVGGHSYGAFNIGDTRVVILDCGEDKPDSHPVYYDLNDFTQHRKDQAEFLEKEIASKAFKSATKRVLIHHIPVYGSNEKSATVAVLKKIGNSLNVRILNTSGECLLDLNL